SLKDVRELLRIAKALSTTSAPQPLLPSSRIQSLLIQSGLISPSDGLSADIRVNNPHRSEIEWVIVGKATVQTYGLVLNTLLDQIIPLSDDIWYWEEVLGSYSYSSYSALQTSPSRLWKWTKKVVEDTKSRFRRYEESPQGHGPKKRSASFSKEWLQFYN